MASISKIKHNGTEYEITDATARENVATLSTAVTNLSTVVTNINTTVTNLNTTVSTLNTDVTALKAIKTAIAEITVLDPEKASTAEIASKINELIQKFAD